MKRQSSLLPYKNEIVTLRRQNPPMSYAQIAELLHEKYQIKINREAIFKFVKACATANEKIKNKSYKPCTYAHKIKLNGQKSPVVSELTSAAESIVPTVLKPSVDRNVIQSTSIIIDRNENKLELELPVLLKPFSHLFEPNISKTTALNEIVNLFSNGQIPEKETIQALGMLLSPEELRELCINIIDTEITKGGYRAHKYELLKREITRTISTKQDTKEIKQVNTERPINAKVEELRTEREARKARRIEMEAQRLKEKEEKEMRQAKKEAEEKQAKEKACINPENWITSETIPDDLVNKLTFDMKCEYDFETGCFYHVDIAVVTQARLLVKEALNSK